MTVNTVDEVKVQLMSRILCVSHISARKAETLLGFYNGGFNIWIEGWKPEQKEHAEVRACVCTASLTPNGGNPPTSLPSSQPVLQLSGLSCQSL